MSGLLRDTELLAVNGAGAGAYRILGLTGSLGEGDEAEVHDGAFKGLVGFSVSVLEMIQEVVHGIREGAASEDFWLVYSILRFMAEVFLTFLHP